LGSILFSHPSGKGPSGSASGSGVGAAAEAAEEGGVSFPVAAGVTGGLWVVGIVATTPGAATVAG